MSRWSIVPPDKMLPDDYTLGPSDELIDRVEITCDEHETAIVVWGVNGAAEHRAARVVRADELFKALDALCAKLPTGRNLQLCNYEVELGIARALVREIQAVPRRR